MKSNYFSVTKIQKKSYQIAIGISGIFLLLDQLSKYLAYTNQSFSAYLIDPWLGWEYLANRGVAFSLPISNNFLVAATPIILLILFVLLAQKKNKTHHYRIAVALLLVGAVSNYIDRVLFGITIDYLRVITAVFNFADVMILTGATGVLIEESQMKKHTHNP